MSAVANRRKFLVPRNIDTMTDVEHWEWYCSLTDEEMDKVQDRTFKGGKEWWFYLETKTQDRELIDCCETLEDAMRHFNECKDDSDIVACEVEETIGHYAVADRDLWERDHKTVASFGTFTE